MTSQQKPEQAHVEFTDADRRREIAAIRANWVDAYVTRRVNHREGDCTTAEIEAWENEGYRQWRGYYPALNSLFPSHLPASGVSDA